VRFRIDQEQLSEFLTKQVRLVEALPVEAAEAAADGYVDGLSDEEREALALPTFCFHPEAQWRSLTFRAGRVWLPG
jgi:hypothetical protein